MDYLSPFLGQLAQGVQVTQQLRAAAEQQKQLEEHKRQFDLEMQLRKREFEAQQTHQGLADQLGLLNAGASPVSGGTYAAPPSTGAMTVEGGRIPTAPERTLNVGGNAYYVPTKGQQFQQELEQAVAKEKALQPFKLGDQVALPDALGRELYPNGGGPAQVNAGVLQALQQAYQDITSRQALADAKANPPAKTPNLQPHFETNDSGNVSAFSFDPVTGETKQTGTFSGAGKRKAAPEGGTKPPTRQQFQMIEQRKQQALAKAGDQLRKDAKAAETDMDPEGSKQRAMDDYRQRMRDAQTAYEQEITALTGQDVGHNDWADRGGQAAQPTAQTPKADQGKQAAPKKVSITKVNQYAQTYKLSLADALKRFKDDGFTVTK